MNTGNITFGELKQIAAMFSGARAAPAPSVLPLVRRAYLPERLGGVA